MVPVEAEKLELSFTTLTKGASGRDQTLCIKAIESLEAAMVEPVPRIFHLILTVTPEERTADFGLALRGSGNFEKGYQLHFLPYERRVIFNQQSISAVSGLDQRFTLEIVAQEDIIDICIDQQRCLIDRCPELERERLFFFCQNGEVNFESIVIAPLQ